MYSYSYVESSVKRKETIATYAIRVLMISAVIFAFFISFYNLFTLVISILLIVGVFYFFPQLKVEYEYVFVDGQMDFDKILGNNKRKTDLRIDFEQVEIMAPQGSSELNSYINMDLKRKNYTSRDPDVNPYVIIYRKGNTGYRILFEPNEVMIKAVRQKVPRKVVLE